MHPTTSTNSYQFYAILFSFISHCPKMTNEQGPIIIVAIKWLLKYVQWSHHFYHKTITSRLQLPLWAVCRSGCTAAPTFRRGRTCRRGDGRWFPRVGKVIRQFEGVSSVHLFTKNINLPKLTNQVRQGEPFAKLVAKKTSPQTQTQPQKHHQYICITAFRLILTFTFSPINSINYLHYQQSNKKNVCRTLNSTPI